MNTPICHPSVHSIDLATVWTRLDYLPVPYGAQKDG